MQDEQGCTVQARMCYANQAHLQYEQVDHQVLLQGEGGEGGEGWGGTTQAG